VDCNQSVAELSLSPVKTGESALTTFCFHCRVIFYLLRAAAARATLRFRTKELKDNERLISHDMLGVGIGDKFVVTIFICSGAQFHSI